MKKLNPNKYPSKYYGLTFEGLLKMVVEESRWMASGDRYFPSASQYNVKHPKHEVCHAAAVFGYKYRISLTVGDVFALEKNFQDKLTDLQNKIWGYPKSQIEFEQALKWLK
jgi:hypothetical protein